MIAPGVVVAEKYWVERVVGRGGMGVVVAATHLALGQRVALKFLKPEAARDPELVERFLREARAAAMLKHPSIVRILDLGLRDDGVPYLVLEHLFGEALGELLRRVGILGAGLGLRCARSRPGFLRASRR